MGIYSSIQRGIRYIVGIYWSIPVPGWPGARHHLGYMDPVTNTGFDLLSSGFRVMLQYWDETLNLMPV